MRRHLIRMPTGYWAFVPPPLPPDLEFDREIVSTLSPADRSLGLLAGAGNWLPNPHLLIRPFLRREAVLSSRIEGTVATEGDLVLFEAAPEAQHPAPDVGEVFNYVRALEMALVPDRVLPISLRLIRDLHRELMTGVRGEHMTPGEFRRSQNWVGPPGCTLNDATFVPPPVDEMQTCLSTFEKYLHERDELPPLVRLAVIHYQFEAIHPFLDGNGRIGRLLISVLMHEWSLLPQPLLYLSAFFERHRADYYDHLLAVSRDGAWRPWVIFFLQGVASESLDALDRITRLSALRNDYRDRLQRTRASALLLKLVDELFAYPAVRIATAQETLGITWRAAAMNVQKLVDVGMLREVTGKERNRIFVADEILALTQESTR